MIISPCKQKQKITKEKQVKIRLLRFVKSYLFHQ